MELTLLVEDWDEVLELGLLVELTLLSSPLWELDTELPDTEDAEEVDTDELDAEMLEELALIDELLAPTSSSLPHVCSWSASAMLAFSNFTQASDKAPS